MRETGFADCLDELCASLLGCAPLKTRHALQRQRERGISDQAIDATLRWGKTLSRQDGRREFLLDLEQTMVAQAHGEELMPYLGTVAIVGNGGVVITVFRRV